MKYIVCYSGGHSSALVAVEAVRRYGKDNVILLNHDISSKVEHEDIKRFKQEVADYLGLSITYANADNFEEMTPLNVSLKNKAFQAVPGQALCTSRLKTQPFYDYLAEHCTDKENFTILYGFDENEENRIMRRTTIMRSMGYKTEYPLANWERTIFNTEEIGISKPVTYRIYKHANCIGCLKAGRQHWYVVYCLRPDIFNLAKEAEKEIGYSIIKDVFMSELEPIFAEMKNEKGICPTEKMESNSFWAMVENILPEQESFLPCDCSF